MKIVDVPVHLEVHLTQRRVPEMDLLTHHPGEHQ
jgi:hypothetical protein